jgi:hypothetical protein
MGCVTTAFAEQWFSQFKRTSNGPLRVDTLFDKLENLELRKMKLLRQKVYESLTTIDEKLSKFMGTELFDIDSNQATTPTALSSVNCVEEGSVVEDEEGGVEEGTVVEDDDAPGGETMFFPLKCLIK